MFEVKISSELVYFLSRLLNYKDKARAIIIKLNKYLRLLFINELLIFEPAPIGFIPFELNVT